MDSEFYQKKDPSSPLLKNKRDFKVEEILLFFIVIVLLLVGLYFFIGKKNNKIESSINDKALLSGASSTVFPPPLTRNYFYGVNVDIAQLVPGSPSYYKNVKGEDYIDIAHRLGINMFRIDNVIPNYKGKSTYSIYTKTEWRWVLNKMAKNGIRAIVLIEAPSRDPKIFSAVQINNSYLDLVNQYILDPEVLNNPDVYAIDLKNEPVLNDNNLFYIQKAADMIRARYPSVKFTVGDWKTDTFTMGSNGKEVYNWHDPVSAGKLSNIIDFYSIHVYGFDTPISGPYPDPYTLTVNYVNQIKQFSGTKPILIEEFGAGNGDIITDQGTIGGKTLQAKVYEGVYKAINSFDSKNILGAVSYEFTQRGPNPEGFAIMNLNGNYLYPAAYVLQNYAIGKFNYVIGNDGNLSSSSYILTNSNYGDLYTVKVGDSIGVELKLSTGDYKTAFTNSGLVSVSEPLQFYNPRSAYEMVFHALSTGTTIFYVYNDSKKCGADMKCILANKVFSVNLFIH